MNPARTTRKTIKELRRIVTTNPTLPKDKIEKAMTQLIRLGLLKVEDATLQIKGS